MKPVGVILAPPPNVRPDGLLPQPSFSQGGFTTLGPFADASDLTDPRAWPREMQCFAQWRSLTAESIECGFFSGDYADTIGGAPSGEGAWYSEATFTYERALDYTPPDPPAFETFVQVHSVQWGYDGDGNQFCTLTKTPEELPGPEPDAGEWYVTWVAFDGALSETHRFEWALELLGVLDIGETWNSTTYAGLVEESVSITSEYNRAGRLDIAFTLATADWQPVTFAQSGTAAFAWRRELLDEVPIVETFEDESVAVSIAGGDAQGTASAVMTVYSSAPGERISVAGPVSALEGTWPAPPLDRLSIKSVRAGVMPFLQPAGSPPERYLAVASEGEDPFDPDIQAERDYTGSAAVSRNATTGAIYVTDAGQGPLPPVLAGIEIQRSGLVGVRFAEDVDSEELPVQNRVPLIYERSGTRKWRVGGVLQTGSHWQRLTLSSLSPDDAEAFALARIAEEDWTDDAADDELRAYAGGGGTMAALHLPGPERLVALVATSTARSADEAVNLHAVWYHAYDSGGIPIGRRVILPNGPVEGAATVIVTGSTLDEKGRVASTWSEVFPALGEDLTPTEITFSAGRGTGKRIDGVLVTWLPASGRLAYPLITAAGAEIP